jgi:hypothetical protein
MGMWYTKLEVITMRKIWLLLTVFSIFLLSACGGIDYNRTSYEVGGYRVYEYNLFGTDVECEASHPFRLFARDGEEDYVTDYDFIDCATTYFIREDGAYVNFNEALDEDYISMEDILAVEWPFELYQTEVFGDYLELDSDISMTFNFNGTSYQYNDLGDIEWLIENSDSVYQAFLIDYLPLASTDDMNALGSIVIVKGTSVLAELIVFEEGIFNPASLGFQLKQNSTLYSVYEVITQ